MDNRSNNARAFLFASRISRQRCCVSINYNDADLTQPLKTQPACQALESILLTGGNHNLAVCAYKGHAAMEESTLVGGILCECRHRSWAEYTFSA